MNDDLSGAEQNARHLLAIGHSDEDVERASGLSLSQLIALRAEAASRPWRVSPTSTHPQATTTFVSDERGNMP